MPGAPAADRPAYVFEHADIGDGAAQQFGQAVAVKDVVPKIIAHGAPAMKSRPIRNASARPRGSA